MIRFPDDKYAFQPFIETLVDTQSTTTSAKNQFAYGSQIKQRYLAYGTALYLPPKREGADGSVFDYKMSYAVLEGIPMLRLETTYEKIRGNAGNAPLNIPEYHLTSFDMWRY